MNLSTTEKKKVYFEQQALLILKHQYPERFNGLQHVGYDKSPDLQDIDASVGIEVTTAFRNQECSFFFDKYYGKRLPKDSKVLSIMARMDCRFQFDEKGQVECMYSDLSTNLSPAQVSEKAGKLIVNSGKKKIDKLNEGHYEIFRTYGLFIFADNRASATTIWNNMESVASYQKEKATAFDLFFVLRNDTLYMFNKHGKCVGNPHVTGLYDLQLQAEEIVGLEQ